MKKKVLAMVLSVAMTVTMAMPVLADSVDDIGTQQDTQVEQSEDVSETVEENIASESDAAETEAAGDAVSESDAAEAGAVEDVVSESDTMESEDLEDAADLVEEQQDDMGVFLQGSDAAASGTCGENVTWELTGDTDTGYTLTISGSGAMSDYLNQSDGDAAPWSSYRDKIVAVNIENGVTTIGAYAFFKCSDLTSVSMPDSVCSIGLWAFAGCSSLTNIDIPENVTSIDMRAFLFCNNLKSIVIPEKTTNLVEYVFGVYYNSADEEWRPISDFICYGYTGSAAETYCMENDIRFESIGEVYGIAYELKGGTNNSSNPDSYKKSSATITLSNPTRKGYDFAGWYEDSSYTAKVTKITSGSTGDKTFYAKWTAHKYHIAFDGNGATSGSMSKMTKRSYGKSYTLTANAFKRTYYTFKGWNTKADGSGKSYKNGESISNLTITDGKTVTLYAQWTMKKYTIAFNGNNATSGSMDDMTGCKYSKSYTLTANAYKRKGYSFKGWNTKADGTGTPYADKGSVKKLTKYNGKTVTLYARWSAIKYTIAYHLNGGTNNSDNPANYKITTSTITLAKATRKGYTFKGWYSDSAFTDKVTEIAKGSTGKKNLYAKWAVKTYTLNYELNGGTNSKSNPATYTVESKTITLKSPKRTGYKFVGWYSDSACTKKVTAVSGGSTGTKTLYARWKHLNTTLGFYESLGCTTARDILENATYASYTTLGGENDATNIKNLQRSLVWLKKCNQLRASEGLDPLYVSLELMAVEESNLNASAKLIAHTQQFYCGENLSWGYSDPFQGWYTEEKANYLANNGGQTGHYLNIVNTSYVITGFATAENGPSYYGGGLCHGQSFGITSFTYDDLKAASNAERHASYIYSVSELQKLLDAYLRKC